MAISVVFIVTVRYGIDLYVKYNKTSYFVSFRVIIIV